MFYGVENVLETLYAGSQKKYLRGLIYKGRNKEIELGRKKICSKQSWANSATLCLLISKFIYCTSNSGKTVTCLENLKAIIQFLSEVKQNLIFHMEAPESFRTHTLVYFQRICSKVALTKVTQEDKLHFGVVKIGHFPRNSNISNVWFTGNPNLSKKSLSTKYAMNIQLKAIQS